ncbi:IclR family transcriptional regulator [Mycobacterium sp. BK086]|nr:MULTISPECIES: helix-turn-helix domain-containing protein [unclassified Mycolicibacterium]TDO06419.1 IclR family transcriptional regulator [Mycobacterium sp. BK086]
MTGRQPRAVTNALEVLEVVARSGPGITGQQIARALNLSPATAYRLLNHLAAEGYVVRLPDLSGFALGRRAIEFADTAAESAVHVSRRARSALSRVRAGTRLGVHLLTFPRGTVHLADADPDHPVPGELALARDFEHSAIGRLLLDEHRRVAKPVSSCPSGRSDGRQLDTAVRLDDFTPDTSCVAVPLRDESGRLIGALAVIGPTDRITTSVEEILEFLCPAALELSELLA